MQNCPFFTIISQLEGKEKEEMIELLVVVQISFFLIRWEEYLH